jgi:Fe-S oxidoreductase
MLNTKFFVLKKTDLGKLLDSLAKGRTVYAPFDEGGSWNFRKMESGEGLDLNGFINSEFPPKHIFMREGEELLEYDKHNVKEKLPDEKAAIFGVRPCDLHALRITDMVMLGNEFVDMHYKKRRDNTLILALNCNEAGENCFCQSMNTCEVEEWYDLLFTDEGNNYIVEAGSKDGNNLIKENNRIFSKTDKKQESPELKFSKEINTENLPRIMEELRESKLWDDVAKRCLSCASCTSVCPTCYCFNMLHDADISDLKKGKILKEHDYCMLLRFTKVAGNVCFRGMRDDRVKQFFYHKLMYGKNRDGKFHCVGCGRCITECMVHIDITEEVRKLREEHGKG